MKLFMLIVVVGLAGNAGAQSLKETLFSGKLKSDSGTVVRKTDDLSTKIDTSRRKAPEPVVKTTTNPAVRDSVKSATGEMVAVPPVAVAGPKDNNKIWKDFIDEFSGTLRTEVLPDKKIKSGTYAILVEYEIGVDGQITVNNVSVSPESSYLGSQVRERLTYNAPTLNPILMTNGKPRAVSRKQMITISKQ
jgi:hypothetical protein